jgi:hypothetical protein
MAVDLGTVSTPQASFVIFMDGFEHYDDLSQKWTSVQAGNGATPEILHGDGTYYGLADTTPDPDVDRQYVKDRGGLLYISGTHYATVGGRGDVDGSWPYVQKYLQRQAVQHVICAMNIKADAYTGVPFLRFLNQAGDLILGFAITPDGSIISCRGTETDGLSFYYGSSAGVIKPGVWTEISIGVGGVTPPNPGDYTYDEGFHTKIDVNGANVAGFGAFYAATRATCQVYEVKLGAAGTNTYISDFICHMGMLNEACCVHALRPEADIGQTSTGAEISGDLLDMLGLTADGSIDDVRGWPPSAGTIDLSSGCSFWGFYVTEELRYPTDLGLAARFQKFLPFICNPFHTELLVRELVQVLNAAYLDAIMAPKEVWMVHEFKGLEYHIYATCQVNALAQGGAFAFGITPYGPDWDSNYLQYQPRGGLHFDIVQVCHRHPRYRYMWSPRELNWLPLGVMAMPEMIEDDARSDEYVPLCESF